MLKKGKKLVRYLAAAMSFTIFLLAATPVWATSVSDLEKQKEELERQKREADAKKKEEQQKYNNASGKVSSIQSEVDEVAEEIDEIDQALVETLASVEIIEGEIKDKEEKIQETTVELEEAQAVEQEQYESMKMRIKFMYEKGDVSYLQIFLESKSFSEMVSKVEYVEKLYEYDRKLLMEYQAAKEAVAALRDRLEEEMSELEAQQHELMEEKESLEILLAETKETFDDYEVKLAHAKQEAAVYKANIKRQNDEIKKLEAQAADKQSQIEAAKKAEEEARRAQEQALRNQAAQEAGNSSSDTSGGSSSGDPSSDSSEGGSSSGGGSYASASSYSGTGSKGQQIANYACQYIGHPYVPGGTSLTDGADCSGFVWRVFKDFGYSLPRTSYSQRSAGSGVSYSNAQPGDIICYAGHVGIYIGNGQIVHASTQKTGIKITNATYKEILSVRRIV